ncbi:MAG: YicC/YloC family endoribonuclease [Desulfonatronovibrionaceae bacterium]
MSISMTGFGSASLDSEKWNISWEIKSVNSKHLDLKWKIPGSLYFLQGKWEKIIRASATRGRVDLYLNLNISDPQALGIGFNSPHARAMLARLEELARDMDMRFDPDLNMFLRVSSLWKEDDFAVSPDLENDLQACLCQALESWNQARTAEGEILVQDITFRLDLLQDMLQKLEKHIQDNTSSKFQEFRQRLQKLIQDTVLEIDENRLLQELALMTDRLDVSEEVTRLKAHLLSMQELLSQGRTVGRKLDFLLQEAFREINTCSNKCQNAHISRIAVDFKAELEKCREQAQNLE